MDASIPAPAPTPPPDQGDASTAGTGTAPVSLAPRPQRNSFLSFLYITAAFLFFMNNGNSPDPMSRSQGRIALQSLQNQLSNYSAWLNGTASNFSLPDEDPTISPLVDLIVNWSGRLKSDVGSYYNNITGFINGDVKLYNLSDMPVTSTHLNDSAWQTLVPEYMAETNMTELVERLGKWNWSAFESINLSVVEKLPPDAGEPSGNITMIQGRIDLADRDGESEKFEFEGVHLVSNGSIYGLVEPNGRHIDIRLLPSVVPTSAKDEVMHAVEPELAARLARFKAIVEAGALDFQYDEEGPKTKCAFALYAQLEATDVPFPMMKDFEEELDKQTGAWTVAAPKLALNGVLISKECGILFKIVNTEGLKSQRFWRKVTTYAGVSTAIYLGLLFLFSCQLDQNSTHTALNRVSKWTVLTQALADCISAVAHITIGILADGRPSMSLIAPAFLACVLLIYEMQYVAMLQQAQVSENAPTTLPPPSSLPPSIEASTADAAASPAPPTPPLTVTRGVLRRFWNFIRPGPSAVPWLVTMGIFIFLARLLVAPGTISFVLGAWYTMFWFPQIVRNVRRGTSRAFSTRYIVGMTLGRAYLPLYLFACPKNLLGLQTSRWSYLVKAFVFVEVLSVVTLILQDYLGPAFFMPKRYASSPTYNYHPPMPLPDSEAPEQSLGDCAICMDAIHVDSAIHTRSSSERKEKGELSVGLLDAVRVGVSAAGVRKSYSLAPCHHLFHTECLEKWLAIKNICPQCRRALPPLS